MSTTPSTTVKARRDPRGYYRRALAIAAPIPFAALAASQLIIAVPGGSDFTETAADIAGRSGAVALGQWLELPFYLLLIPAILAVASVTWRAVPRMTAVAVSITVPGFAAAFAVLPPNSYTLATLTDQLGLDVNEMAALSKAWEEHPTASVGGLLFIVSLVIGLGLLGIALWRSRRAPAWMGWALTLGTVTHPFLPGPVIAPLGLLVAAVGMAGATVALVRTSNDDFALPVRTVD
jgi:hypothetical protein